MTLSLFPESTASCTDLGLREIFNAWIDYRATSESSTRTERALKEESAKVYQEMWSAFASFCGEQNYDLRDITANEIRNFLAQRARTIKEGKRSSAVKGPTLSPRYAWRMLTLIDRVTRFHAQRHGISANPAARDLLELPEYRYANAGHKDPLPDYYSDTEVNQLIAHLKQTRTQNSPASPMSWKAVRDCAIIALMLGGGLSPGDARAATLDGIYTEAAPNVPWKLALPGNGNAPARETPLAHWSGEILLTWLTVRAEHDIAGAFLFPSTLSGKPLSHTSCYEICKAVLAEAGFANDNGGVFKLRHTFALRQLASGRDENEVARWLGLLDINSMAKYRRVVTQPVDLA